MKQIYISIILLMVLSINIAAQNTGVIRGRVIDLNTQEEIIGASVIIDGTTTGAKTDINGDFSFEAPIGSYSVKASYIGYSSESKYNIQVKSGNEQIIKFSLTEEDIQLKGVEISFNNETSASATDMITPLSVQALTAQEIQSNPGGNFDVSKVVQTLPGVGSSSGGGSRNDIIIRGGAPNENVYYLDGIEVPVINHFQTQGSSGGAQGILNVAFIEELKLSSSAFDARYDNALSSTFVIKQRDGNPERVSGSIRSGLTESALVLEGPIGKNKKTTFLASARQSYLGLLFSWIDIPIRPNYFDYQYKVTHRFDKDNSLTLLGLGAIDNFTFAQQDDATADDIYIKKSQPYINQNNYTAGLIYKHKIDKGFVNLSFSRNYFENNVDKYQEGEIDPTAQTLGLSSYETENKLKLDYNKYINGWKLTGGLATQYVEYNTDFFSLITQNDTINVNSNIDFLKYGAFAQVAKIFFNKKLLVTAGARTDMNSFTDTGMNPLKTISPRLSLKYYLLPKLDLVGSIGQYYRTPTYTSLGYRDINNELINKDMDYIQSTHYVFGAEYMPNDALRFVAEGFYKQYANYPVSAETGVSFANLGNDFGSIGSEEVISSGKGEAKGFELSVQQKKVKDIFYVLSYTYVRSSFSGADGILKPSSWDNRNLFSGTVGYIFKKDYELGLKYRYAGGTPYTPYDEAVSQASYLLLGSGTLDYTQTNSGRLSDFNQLDIRLDKKFNFKNMTLEVFIDIQNVLMAENESTPTYTFERTDDNSGFKTTDGLAIKSDGSNGIPKIIKNTSATIIPTIGAMLMF